MTLTITQRLSSGSSSDLTQYNLGSPINTDGALLVLHVSAGWVDFAQIASISGTLGLTWTVVQHSPVPNNNVYSTVLAAYSVGGSGTVLADFLDQHTNCVWKMHEITSDVGIPTIRQSKLSAQAAQNPSVTFDDPALADSLLVGYLTYNAGSAQNCGAGANFNAIGSRNVQNSPTNTNFAIYRQQDGGANDTDTVAFTTTNASGSVVTGIEVYEYVPPSGEVTLYWHVQGVGMTPVTSLKWHEEGVATDVDVTSVDWHVQA